MAESVPPAPSQSKPVRRPAGWRWVGVGLAVLMTATVIGTTAYVTGSKDDPTPPPAAPKVVVVDTPTPIGTPLAPGDGIDTGPGGPAGGNGLWADADQRERDEVKRFFTLFGEAVRAPEWGSALGLFWLHHLVPSPPIADDRFGITPGESIPDSWRFARTVVRRETAVWRTWDWAKADVRRVTKLPDSERYEAIVWHTTADGSRVKRRWHLMDNDGAHLVALGWEDLHTGISAWDLAVTEAQAEGTSRKARDQGRFRQLTQVYRHLDADRLDDARKVLEPLLRVRFEPTLQYAVDLAEARLLRRTIPSDAREICEESVRKDRHRLATHLLLAELCLDAEEYERVKEVCDSYTAVVGDDPDTLALKAEAHYRLVETDDANAAFEQALKLDPFQPLALNWKRRGAAGDGKKATAEVLARAPKPPVLFDALARGAEVDEDWNALAALAQQFRELKPADHRGAAKLIVALYKQKKPDEAVAAFREAIPKLTGPERGKLGEAFYFQMSLVQELGKVYAALPDDLAEKQFRRLAAVYLDRVGRFRSNGYREQATTAVTELNTLTEAHRKRFPDDVWLTYCDGRLKVTDKDDAGAEKAFAEVLKKIPFTGDAEKDAASGYGEVQYEQTAVLYRLGRGADALRTLKPTAAVFGRLASLAVQAGDADGLAKLLDERKTQTPGVPEPAFWRAEWHWLRKEFAAAAPLYRAALDVDDFQPFVDRGKARERLMRWLCRSRQTADATAELVAWENPPAVYRVLVPAAAGDVDTTIKTARAILEEMPHMAGVLYGDPDLGPLLEHRSYQRFREEFPPPQEKQKK